MTKLHVFGSLVTAMALSLGGCKLYFRGPGPDPDDTCNGQPKEGITGCCFDDNCVLHCGSGSDGVDACTGGVDAGVGGQDAGSRALDAGSASCGGAVSCTTAPPTCRSGQVPTIANGCWTGNCEAISACDVPPACSEINDEPDCAARSDCEVVSEGIDCMTSTGAACTSGDTGCTCASYVFASCHSKN